MQKDLCAGLFSAKMAFHTPHLYKSFASFKNTVLRNKNTPNAGTLTNISLNSFAFFGALVALYFLQNLRKAAVFNFSKENAMKSSIRDKMEGTGHEVKGTAKEAVGRLSNNPRLEVEGTIEKIVGKVQRKNGQVKKVFERV